VWVELARARACVREVRGLVGARASRTHTHRARGRGQAAACNDARAGEMWMPT